MVLRVLTELLLLGYLVVMLRCATGLFAVVLPCN